MSLQQHQDKASDALPTITCAVLTISDTRTPQTDTSGQFIRESLVAEGHQIVAYHVIKDESSEIEAIINKLTAAEAPPQAILINGGTGISSRDRTYDVISRLLEKPLPGFGELFRMLSYEEIGAASMLSRATAGVYRECVIFSMPGSTNAVKLAMKHLILSQIRHIVWELKR